MWEYADVWFRLLPFDTELNEEYSNWELVAIVPCECGGYRLYFKRPKGG